MRRPVRFAAALGLAAAALVSAGCRNPFNPAADIQLDQIETRDNVQWGNMMPEIGVYSTQVQTTPIDFTVWKVDFRFRIENKVGVVLNSVNTIYTDYDDNPVTVYGETGREYNFILRLDPIDSNSVSSFVTRTLTLYVIDDSVIKELMSPSYPSDKVMFANITFRGEDDNGYDVRLTARMTIKGYGL